MFENAKKKSISDIHTLIIISKNAEKNSVDGYDDAKLWNILNEWYNNTDKSGLGGIICVNMEPNGFFF